MRLYTRAISFVLLVSLLLTLGAALPVSSASTATSTGTNARYTQKIVSVLYDNSGSMDADDKNEYALYALQVLMALLSDNDVLVITPMNQNSQTVTNTSAGVEVDLASSDRNAEIKRVLSSSSSFLSKAPSGGTPGSAISVAVDQLEARGLKNKENLAASVASTEHWLVVLTDGQFNEQTSTKGADAIIEQYIQDFPSLRTIYLGLGSDAPDLSASSLSQKMLFTPYRAASPNDIVNTMQSVANQLSGRYTLDQSCYTVNGTTVTVDLDKCELSFKNVSIIAQDCGVTLVSAKHDGAAMTITNPCIITPEGLTSKVKDGFSAVISDSSYLTGGKLVLEFSNTIPADKISILAEPALIIDTYFECKDGDTWKRTTMQYINANLSEGDEIKVGYEVYEQANGGLIDLNKVFGDCTATVVYAGQSYTAGTPMPLVVGNNEIGISISVMNGAYTMYSSTICIIDRHPTYYRVEQVGDDEISGATNQAKVVYTVYADNRPLSVTELSKYKWELTAKAPNGTDADCTTTVGPDGKITAIVTAEMGAYGDYTLEFTVTSEYNISRYATQKIGYSPASIEIKETPSSSFTFANGSSTAKGEYVVLIGGEQLTATDLTKLNWGVKAVTSDGSETPLNTTVKDDGTITAVLDVPDLAFGEYRLTVSVIISEAIKEEYTHTAKKYPNSIEINSVGDASMSLSQNELTGNSKGFDFGIIFDGIPFDAGNSLITYKATANGIDVTQHLTYENDLVSYVPHADHFGGTAPIGEVTVTVTASIAGTALSSTTSTTLNVTQTLYEIISIDHDGKTSGRFRMEDAPAALYFKVLRDGIPLSKEELTKALESGSLKITDNKGTFTWQVWLPCGRDITVEEFNGEPVVAFRVKRDWIKPFHSFAAMLIFNGDSPITAEYEGAQGTDAITFKGSPAWSYIWRILVILFIIHCILYIIGFFNGKCKSLPSGVFVSTSIYGNSDECSFRIAKELNLTFWEKYGWHVARFFPHKRKLWYNQEPITVNNLIYGYDDNGALGFHCTRAGIYRVIFDNNGSGMANHFSDYKRALAGYDGKSAKPKIKGAISDKPTGSEVRSILKFQPGEGYIEQNSLTNYPFYGKRDEDDALSFVIFFVRHQ